MIRYNLTQAQVLAASAEILAAVALRNGEPDHKFARTGDPEEDSFLSWDSGTWLRWAQTPTRWLLGVREKDRAWPAPRWLAFDLDPNGSGLLAQVQVGDLPRPAFAITSDHELVEVEVSDVRSGLYFLSTVDLSRVHKTRDGCGRQVCELCLEPVEGEYVERVHRQGGDQRRSHLACAQAAIDGVLREQLEDLDPDPPSPPDAELGDATAPDSYFANYVHEQTSSRRSS